MIGQVIWQVRGSAGALMDRLGLDQNEEDPQFILHAGRGTLAEAQVQSARNSLVRHPQAVPDPLIVMANVNVIGDADVYDSDAPCLIVGPAFLSEFSNEIKDSCRVYGVRVVLFEQAMDGTRDELLRLARPEGKLFAVNPLHVINVDAPEPHKEWDDPVIVPDSIKLPPFFRVPWYRGAVFIRNDIKQRIEARGFKDVNYNSNPWP